MNANAYGGELARVLEWVDVASADGVDRRTPDRLGFSYRRSNLEPGEVVARAGFRLSEEESAAVKERMSGMRDRRREAQPSGIKTFGSTFKNPDDPARGGAHRGPASRGGRLPGPPGGRREVLAQARELRRERR